MAFRIRDLMISVLAPAAGVQGCPTCTGTTGDVLHGCHGQTGLGCQTCTGTTNPQFNLQAFGQGCNLCTGTTVTQVAWGCPGCTGTVGCQTCTGTTGGVFAQAAALAACGVCTGFSPALGDQRPQALAQLRQQLQGLLAEVEAEEKRLADEAFPQSAAEAEALEKKLEEALAEVRSRKAAFGKKKKG